jgi:hypothetical protein
MARRAEDVGRGRSAREAGEADEDEEEGGGGDERAQLLAAERAKQDEHLDALHASALRLGEMSRTISVELRQQDKCVFWRTLRRARALFTPRTVRRLAPDSRRVIEEVNHGVETADGKLEATSRRIREFVDRNGACGPPGVVSGGWVGGGVVGVVWGCAGGTQSVSIIACLTCIAIVLAFIAFS